MLGLALFSGCGADDTPQDDDDGSSSSAPTDDGDCTPGYEGCACAMDTCLAGLQCLSGLCVDAGPPEATTTDGEDTTPAEENSGEDTSTGTPLTAGEESSTSDEQSSTSGVSTEESSTTEPEPECLEGDDYCTEATFQTCVDGQWVYSTCVEHCAITGYDSPGCADANDCECLGFADDVCESAAYNLCLCADIDYDIPCTDEQWGVFYDECFQMVNEYVICFYDYPIDEVADCAPAEAACL